MKTNSISRVRRAFWLALPLGVLLVGGCGSKETAAPEIGAAGNSQQAAAAAAAAQHGAATDAANQQARQADAAHRPK